MMADILLWCQSCPNRNVVSQLNDYTDMMAIFLPPTCPIIILTCHLILGRIYVKTTGDNYIMSVNSSVDLEHMLGKSNMIYIGNYFKLKKIICIHINNHIYNTNL
jgi:hypothetical protein